jgi:hypothetical protein
MIKRRSLLGIPLARRSARRLFVVGYWAVALLLVAAESQLWGSNPNQFLVRWILVLILSLPGYLGGTDPRGAVREFNGPTPDDPDSTDYTFMTVDDIAAKKLEERERRLDERDTMLRNAIHYRAYAILRRSAILVAFSLLVLSMPTFARFAHLRMLLLWCVFIVFMSLPQSIILWTEPDMEEVQ